MWERNFALEVRRKTCKGRNTLKKFGVGLSKCMSPQVVPNGRAFGWRGTPGNLNYCLVTQIDPT